MDHHRKILLLLLCFLFFLVCLFLFVFFFFTSDLLAVSHVFCVPFKHARVTFHFNMYNQPRAKNTMALIHCSSNSMHLCSKTELTQRCWKIDINLKMSCIPEGEVFIPYFFSSLCSRLTPFKLDLTRRNSCSSSFQLWAHTVCRIWMIVCIFIILGTIMTVMWWW